MGLAERLAGQWRIVHPFPTVAVTAAAAGFGLLAAGKYTPGLLLLVGTVFASQVAIGSLNDYLDRHHDAVEQPEKPIPSGLLPPSVALAQAAIAAFACVAVAALTGPAGLFFATIALASGLVYDIRLKSTVASFLPYLISFSCLPAFAWAATGAFQPRWLALYAVGLPLMLSLHLANALPDVAGDQREGVHGLAPTLGVTAARALCWSAYLAAGILAALVIALLAAPDRRSTAAGLVLSALLFGLAAFTARDSRRSSLLAHFRFLAVGGLIMAGSTLAAIQ
jgi:4-hydroxybenzoate polyprenyltransferase